MLKYIIKRVIIFIPTLVIITLITFIISLNAPGDPVDQMLGTGGGDTKVTDKLTSEKTYMETRAKLGLDLPVFYFSLSSMAKPDTLYRIPKITHQKMLKRLISKYGNWKEIESYYHTLRGFDKELSAVKKNDTIAGSLIRMRECSGNLFLAYKQKEIDHWFGIMDSVVAAIPQMNFLKTGVEEVEAAFQNILDNKTSWKNFIPAIHFYGKNQYHRWLFGDGKYTKGLISGDFGISFQNKQKISSVIWDRLKWTMLISFISILLTYAIAIPIGVHSAVNKGSLTDKFSTTSLFVLYSLPNFWIATMLMTFLGGAGLGWFPTYGIGNDKIREGMSFFQVSGIRLYHFFLPLVCWTYGNLAYLSRQMRGGMLAVMNQDYIRTARSKGLSEGKVIWKHSLRNSLLPIITLFAYIFPTVIAGSVVLEVIFQIPGMGKWGYDAIIFRDYPVIFTTMFLGTVLTLVGYLVADILYAVVDPRISYTSKK